MGSTRNAVFVAAGLAALSGGAAARHVDALLTVEGGQLRTGHFDFDTGSVICADVRVYPAEFDIFGTTDAPGFNALTGGNLPAGFDALPGSTAVDFGGVPITVDGTTSNLWFWDGQGAVGFQPVSGGTTLNVSKAPSFIFSADFDGSASAVTGFTIDFTGSTGSLHKHVDFTVLGAPTAADGFYLWSFVLTIGALTSEPMYFVHALGDQPDSVHSQAVAWVRENIVESPCRCAADVDQDGAVDVDDLYAVHATPVDVNGDGFVDAEDTACMVNSVRADESLEMLLR